MSLCIEVQTNVFSPETPYLNLLFLLKIFFSWVFYFFVLVSNPYWLNDSVLLFFFQVFFSIGSVRNFMYRGFSFLLVKHFYICYKNLLHTIWQTFNRVIKKKDIGKGTNRGWVVTKTRPGSQKGTSYRLDCVRL